MPDEPLAIQTAREKAASPAGTAAAANSETSVDGYAQTLVTAESPQQASADDGSDSGNQEVTQTDQQTAVVGNSPTVTTLAMPNKPTVNYEPDSEPLPFTEIGGVKLKQKLGQGGMGAVYLGYHEHLDMDVAVKLVLPNGSQLEERFLQECRLAARIVHPNVVRVFNAGKEQNNLYLILELVTGGDVSELAKSGGPMAWRRACDIVQQAAQGLGAAHTAGIVHRDVKPGNLMLSEDGTVKVADLGLAKTHDVNIEITQTGSIMGTPAYMAPEQAMDVKKAGPAADVYALGITLFNLISGELPFKGDTSTKVILAHLNDPIPDLRKIVNDIPEELGSLIKRLLAKEPADRPQNGDEVAAELKTLLNSGVTRKHRASAVEASQSSEGKNAFPLILAALAAAVIMAIVATISFSGQSTSDANAPASAGVAAAPLVSESPNDDPAAAWQSPTRNLFILHSGDPSIEAALYEGGRQAGRRLVEREALDTLLAEQDMTRAGYTDTDEAINLGRLLGGHMALISEPIDKQSASMRLIYIETGELVGGPLTVSGEDAAAKLQAMIEKAPSMPSQGTLSFDAAFNEWVVSLGTQHHIKVGDRFVIMSEPEGKALTGAEISATNASTSTVSLLGSTSLDPESRYFVRLYPQ